MLYDLFQREPLRALLAGCLVAGLISGCRPAASTSLSDTAPVDTSSLPDNEALRELLDEALDVTRARQMDPSVQNAWQIVHGVLAFGPGLNLRVQGETVPALDYLLQGGTCEGWEFEPGDRGLEAVMQPGTKKGQGHEDQWLGYLSQIGLRSTDELVVGGKTYTVADLITQAQADMRPHYEATWTLMAFGVFMPSDASWTARDGTVFTMERLLALETGQELRESACGGTHRMYAITTAVNQRMRDGLPLDGVWGEAHAKIQQCVANARKFQQPDGGFSVNYFERSGTAGDLGKRINTTGHVLEFLCVALTDEQLRQPWMVRAAQYLAEMLIETKDLDLECGGLYHAAHGLLLYRQRLFGLTGYAGEYMPPTPPSQVDNSAPPPPPPVDQAARQ